MVNGIRYLFLVLVVAITGCSDKGGNNSQVIPVTIPVIDPDLPNLMAGYAVTGPVINDCDDPVSTLEIDALNILCELFGGGNTCITASSKCNTYRREIYAGSSIVPPPDLLWSGRGGSGKMMSDAAVCAMRELSTSKGIGPLISESKVNIGIGDVNVKQEVGYLDFDRTTGTFRGYRKLNFNLPVLGKFDAISQDVVLRRSALATTFNPSPYAGSALINYAYGLDLSSQEKQRSLNITPPAFDVITPIGTFQAQPKFVYNSHTSVIDAPFTSNHTDVSFLPDTYNQPVYVKLNDIYGVIPGVSATKAAIPIAGTLPLAPYRNGWISQIGLGTRGTGSESVWTPPAQDPYARPDYDPFGLLDFSHYTPRSNDENQPSIHVQASATLRYPTNAADLLPSWVFSLPNVSVDAYIEVSPTIEAGGTGQLGFVLSEGNNFTLYGEHGFTGNRFAALGMYTGVKADASFYLDTALKIKVSANFCCFVGNINVINIHPHFPIPLAGGTPNGSAVRLASATAESSNTPVATLTSLKTFKGIKSDPAGFIEQCYAKENQAPAEVPPAVTPEKGDPEKLTPELWYCNICIATDAIIAQDGSGTQLEPAHADFLIPASTLPTSWQCDGKSKSGCMEICSWNPETGVLTVVKTPDQIAANIPTTDPQHDFFLSCKYPAMTGTVVLSKQTPSGDAPVPVTSNIAAQFNTALDPATVNTNTVTITPSVGGELAYDDSSFTVTFTPRAPLEYERVYTATFSTGITDTHGNPLDEETSWSFTTEAAPEQHAVFVTSVEGNGDLGSWADAGGNTGVAAGDAICQARAAAAGRSGYYIAWLSDAANDAYCRVQNLSGKKSANCGQGTLPVNAGPWLRSDQFPFSAALGDLIDSGIVYAPAALDESGNTTAIGTTYFSGTNANGTADISTSTCYDWTSSSANSLLHGVGGFAEGTTYSWTHNFSASCASSSSHLLCMQSGTATTLPPFVSAGKKVFVTSTEGSGRLDTWTGAGPTRGIPAGDAICQSRAAEAGLANAATFKAWLSDQNTDAAARLSSDGPWVRIDGVMVANNKADLIDGDVFTAISVTEQGIYKSTTAWTNSYANGSRASIASTCANWTSADGGSDSAVGETSLANDNWSKTGYGSCSSARALYCFEDQ